MTTAIYNPEGERVVFTEEVYEGKEFNTIRGPLSVQTREPYLFRENCEVWVNEKDRWKQVGTEHEAVIWPENFRKVVNLSGEPGWRAIYNETFPKIWYVIAPVVTLAATCAVEVAAQLQVAEIVNWGVPLLTEGLVFLGRQVQLNSFPKQIEPYD